MIEGITILAQEEILYINVIGAFLCLLVSVALGFLVGGILSSIFVEDSFWFVCFILSAIVGFTLFFYNLENGKPTGEYKYRVTIDETVSITEFYERYEILDQDGLIYEIKERDFE